MAQKQAVTDEDRKLGRIGLRGIVLHSGDPEGGEYEFYPDNDTESWRKFGTELLPFADDRQLNLAQLQALEETGVAVAVLLQKNQFRTFFLNLDGFRGLQIEGDPIDPSARTTRVSPDDDAILIREDRKYYSLSRSDLYDLDRKDAGEAKIVVRRGAVAAAIPNNDLPLGTNCVLINLTQLLGPIDTERSQSSEY